MKMRSWLFSPGDSEKKMGKALAGPADIILLDLEDAVATENKSLARTMIHDFLLANAEERSRIWVRINPLDGPYTLEDLVAVMPARPGGIMLPKVYGRGDVELLDNYLTALEAAYGIESGSTPVIVLVTETAEAMFHTGDYKGAPRVVALTWGGGRPGRFHWRQFQPQPGWQLRLHLRDGAQHDTARRGDRRGDGDRDHFRRFPRSRGAASASRKGPP